VIVVRIRWRKDWDIEKKNERNFCDSKDKMWWQFITDMSTKYHANPTYHQLYIIIKLNNIIPCYIDQYLLYQNQSFSLL
jgi:hypothetical protein